MPRPARLLDWKGALDLATENQGALPETRVQAAGAAWRRAASSARRLEISFPNSMMIL